MIDRLPHNVSHLVVSQWLSLVSIVRLDTALLKSTVRAEWLELLSCCTVADECAARNANAQLILSWVMMRKLKFASYVIEVTVRNKWKRISILSSACPHVKKLSIIQVSDNVRTIGYGDMKPTVSSGIASAFNFVFRRKRYERNASIPNIEYDVDREDGILETSEPILVLPELSWFSLSGSYMPALQWLPEAPRLQSLSIGRELLDDAFLVRIIAAYPQLRSISLDLTHRVSNDSVRAIAEGCPHLTTVNFTNEGSSVDFASILSSLFRHCPQLSYVAIDCARLADEALAVIAEYGERILGLDLVYSRLVTSRGLHALAVACPNLTSLGITCKRAVHTEDYAALQQLLLTNAGTLHTVAIQFGTQAAANVMAGDLTVAVLECAKLCNLHLSFIQTTHSGDATGVKRILERCPELQVCYLHAVTQITPSPWFPSLQAEMKIQFPRVLLEWKRVRMRPVWEWH